MHLVYVVLAIVSLVLGGVSHARAQEMTDQMPTEQRRMMGNERPSGLSTEQQNRFINLVRNATGRMESAITRLEKISTRLDARILKLNAEGIDTTEAAASLEEAKRTLADAKAKLATLKPTTETALVSDTPRERFKAAREESTEVRTAIRSAFLKMRESVNMLRDITIEMSLNKKAIASNN